MPVDKNKKLASEEKQKQLVFCVVRFVNNLENNNTELPFNLLNKAHKKYLIKLNKKPLTKFFHTGKSTDSASETLKTLAVNHYYNTHPEKFAREDYGCGCAKSLLRFLQGGGGTKENSLKTTFLKELFTHYDIDLDELTPGAYVQQRFLLETALNQFIGKTKLLVNGYEPDYSRLMSISKGSL